MWAAQHFRWRTPRSMVTSGGLGTMGFGLPSAIGAKVGAPKLKIEPWKRAPYAHDTACQMATNVSPGRAKK